MKSKKVVRPLVVVFLLLIVVVTMSYWGPCFGVTISHQARCWAKEHLCPSMIPDWLCLEKNQENHEETIAINNDIVVFLKYEEREDSRLDQRWTVKVNGRIVFAESLCVTTTWAGLTKDYCFNQGHYTHWRPTGKDLFCTVQRCWDEEGRIVPLIWLSPKPECPRE